MTTTIEVGKLKIVGDVNRVTIYRDGPIGPFPLKTIKTDRPEGDNNALELGRKWAEENQDKAT